VVEVNKNTLKRNYSVCINGNYVNISEELVELYHRGKRLHNNSSTISTERRGHNILLELYSEHGIGCTSCTYCSILIDPPDYTMNIAVKRCGPGAICYRCGVHGYTFGSTSDGKGGGWDTCLELDIKENDSCGSDIVSKFQLF